MCLVVRSARTTHPNSEPRRAPMRSAAFPGGAAPSLHSGGQFVPVSEQSPSPFSPRFADLPLALLPGTVDGALGTRATGTLRSVIRTRGTENNDDATCRGNRCRDDRQMRHAPRLPVNGLIVLYSPISLPATTAEVENEDKLME